MDGGDAQKAASASQAKAEVKQEQGAKTEPDSQPEAAAPTMEQIYQRIMSQKQLAAQPSDPGAPAAGAAPAPKPPDAKPPAEVSDLMSLRSNTMDILLGTVSGLRDLDSLGLDWTAQAAAAGGLGGARAPGVQKQGSLDMFGSTMLGNSTLEKLLSGNMLAWLQATGAAAGGAATAPAGAAAANMTASGVLLPQPTGLNGKANGVDGHAHVAAAAGGIKRSLDDADGGAAAGSGHRVLRPSPKRANIDGSGAGGGGGGGGPSGQLPVLPSSVGFGVAPASGYGAPGSLAGSGGSGGMKSIELDVANRIKLSLSQLSADNVKLQKHLNLLMTHIHDVHSENLELKSLLLKHFQDTGSPMDSATLNARIAAANPQQVSDEQAMHIAAQALQQNGGDLSLTIAQLMHLAVERLK